MKTKKARPIKMYVKKEGLRNFKITINMGIAFNNGIIINFERKQ